MILSRPSLFQRLASCCSDRIVIAPLAEGAVQASSIDLRLGSTFVIDDGDFNWLSYGVVDLAVPSTIQPSKVAQYDEMVLLPGEFILGTTLERVEVPLDLEGEISGKSSLARIGLQVHLTAGYIHPGYHGTITLELKNQGRRPIVLHAGMWIAQILFHRLDAPVARGYDGLYQDNLLAQPARTLADRSDDAD